MSYEVFGEMPQTGDVETTRRIARPLYEARGWMKFLAVLALLMGAMYAITIIGLVFAWLPIWMGVLLWQAADRVERAVDAGDPQAATDSLAKLKTMFTIQGVLALIGVGVFVLVLVVAIGGGLAGLGRS